MTSLADKLTARQYWMHFVGIEPEHVFSLLCGGAFAYVFVQTHINDPVQSIEHNDSWNWILLILACLIIFLQLSGYMNSYQQEEYRYHLKISEQQGSEVMGSLISGRKLADLDCKEEDKIFEKTPWLKPTYNQY